DASQTSPRRPRPRVGAQPSCTADRNRPQPAATACATGGRAGARARPAHHRRPLARRGLTVAHATKGIVLDGSVGTVIDGVEIFDIGDGYGTRNTFRRNRVEGTIPGFGIGLY